MPKQQKHTTNLRTNKSKIRIARAGKIAQSMQDEQIELERRCKELEEELFSAYFDEASKPDEIKALKEEIQRLKEAIAEKNKSSLPVHENAFIHNGDAWEIWFNGTKLKPIKEIDGFTYITKLLKSPCNSIHVSDLCASTNQRKVGSMLTDIDLKDSLNTRNMSISTMQDEELDPKAKKEIKRKISELNEIINDPDSLDNERNKAKDELNHIQKSLGIFGKNPLHYRAPKKVNKSVKDDMDRVREAMKRACEKIRKQAPKLADYIEKNIKTGSEYSFADTSISWDISE